MVETEGGGEGRIGGGIQLVTGGGGGVVAVGRAVGVAVRAAMRDLGEWKEGYEKQKGENCEM